jgi:hypothetical protein
MNAPLRAARTRNFVSPLVLAAIAIALSVAHTSSAANDHVPIGYVKVRYVTQPPARPVVIRLVLKAPRKLSVRVGYTILNRSGKPIYRKTSPPFETHFLLDVTGITIRWHKKDSAGRPVPARRGYFVEPFAIDLEDRDNDDRPGAQVRGRRYFFPLEEPA